MPKNLFFRMKSQTSGGRSRFSQFSFQSSTIAQSSRVGPSRNAFSSAERLAGFIANRPFQSGFPENISPSNQTEPASIAERSVSEMGGITPFAQLKIGLLIRSRLKSRRPMIAPLSYYHAFFLNVAACGWFHDRVRGRGFTPS